MAAADLSVGDCAYLPRNSGHSVRNIGDEACEVVGVHDAGAYTEATVADWLNKAPRHALATNFGMADGALARFGMTPGGIVLAR